MPESSTEKQSPQCPDEIEIDKTENLAKPLNEPGGWPESPDGNSCNPCGYPAAQSSFSAPENDLVTRENKKIVCPEYELRPPGLESMLVMRDIENF